MNSNPNPNPNSYSNITSKLNYNKGIKQQNNIENLYSFDKFQQNMESINNNDYYCGGNSSLALKSIMENTPVSIKYFSKENTKRIQDQIKIVVNKYFKGKITLDVDQDEQDLLLIMRHIYIEFGYNLPSHINGQVKDLNKRTISYIIPILITNIKQQYKYIQDLHNPITTLDHPINANNAGRQSLPSLTSSYGF